MLDRLAEPSRSLSDLILPLYLNTTFSYALATLMAIVAFLLVAVALYTNSVRVRQIRNRERAIVGEISGLSGGTHTDGASSTEAYFRERFAQLDNLFSQTPAFASGLSLAWLQYRRTLSQTPTGIYQSPYRPRTFFLPALRSSSFLDFAANIFVAFGLLATFVGLVAGLTFAASGMESAAPGAMTDAMTNLLAASASKFVTSIAGVGLSIILRIFGRALTMRQQNAMTDLSNALESAIRIAPGPGRVPPQPQSSAS